MDNPVGMRGRLDRTRRPIVAGGSVLAGVAEMRVLLTLLRSNCPRILERLVSETVKGIRGVIQCLLRRCIALERLLDGGLEQILHLRVVRI